ncbi:folliculin [Thrips palmi]|uniref:Folliculin n=1 Tax=Thrips palmi TaxID=161013 RepID=A0A6P8ZYB6_THRPL|nr:folliculin [Thrips palmi]
MNAVVSLCHFCELHGPSVLISTQACRAQNRSSSPKKRTFYGPPDCFQASSFASTSSCEACQPLGNNVYITSDHDTETSYVSSQFPYQSETEALVRQACTRSLSCEVSPGKEGILVFSDDPGLGSSSCCSVLSHTFLIRDCLARGFHRWFSITVLTRDRLLLLNMWPFLEKNISIFVSELQISANKVYEVEQNVRPQRALRLSTAFCSDKSSRPLSELTGSSQVFAQIHLWFVWLLQNAATRLRETLPLVESVIPLDPIEEVQGGLVYVSAKNCLYRSENISDSENSPSCLVKATGPSIKSLATLRLLLGPVNFASIVYCLLVGRQVVVRGQPAVLVASILLTLKTLLPRGCIRLVPFSTNYLPLSECNMLGIDARAAVPQPSPHVARLEVLLPSEGENPEPGNLVDVSKFSFHLKWPGQLPSKWPSFLSKLDRAMQSEFLSERTLMFQIGALRMETLNAARVMHTIENQDKKDSYDSRDKTALLQALGVNLADTDVMSFWSKCCLNM